MLKKIIFWTLYIIFVGGLIWGAINRTSSILEEEDKNISINHIRETNPIAETEPTPSKDHPAPEIATKWEILKGEISILSNRGATFTLENGSTLSINPRAWRFALEHGLQAQLGDTLLLTGFYEEDGKFELAHLRSLNNGTVVQIRDEDGHPLWVSNENGE